MIRRSKKHPQGEALRYLANAREILETIEIDGDFYADVKPVREAFGTAYLAILEAIDEVLIHENGLSVKELPQSVDSYRAALQKHISVHNGKLLKDFERLYGALHIAGYYRGLITETNSVKDYLKVTERFIKKLIGN
ncbi:MAG: DUF5618 family protein [Nitrospirae bacterium]|nr:DUF5618 family protein [Nitrospirota bacterium]MBF0536513.1 DUF5618 family protein [Nitrospirota bacterium]MBF0617835.1 DUF5618 family protein [Nitrospirota bacterium]